MLKPIHKVACSPALAACQALMQRFALWLCHPSTTGVTRQSLQPPTLLTAIEADWLWLFLQYVHDRQTLLARAELIATLPIAEKAVLTNWIQAVSALPAQFLPAPAVSWPTDRPNVNGTAWGAFKTLMEKFYEKGFRSGLPYLANGTPTASVGINYREYVENFRHTHLLSPHPDAREICVLCGGPLGDTPHVDHWINKSAYPILSVCENNLQLICSTCNEPPNKGQNPTYSAGGFANWFHPYLRSGYGALKLEYSLRDPVVRCSALAPVDQPKADSLNTLLNLSRRWTREFKSEYNKHKNVLLGRERRRIQQGQARHTQAEVHAYLREWQTDLAHLSGEPHHAVHETLAAAFQEPSRIAALHQELNLLQR